MWTEFGGEAWHYSNPYWFGAVKGINFMDMQIIAYGKIYYAYLKPASAGNTPHHNSTVNLL